MRKYSGRKALTKLEPEITLTIEVLSSHLLDRLTMREAAKYLADYHKCKPLNRPDEPGDDGKGAK